jgi:hypothetical protein
MGAVNVRRCLSSKMASILDRGCKASSSFQDVTGGPNRKPLAKIYNRVVLYSRGLRVGYPVRLSPSNSPHTLGLPIAQFHGVSSRPHVYSHFTG